MGDDKLGATLGQLKQVLKLEVPKLQLHMDGQQCELFVLGSSMIATYLFNNESSMPPELLSSKPLQISFGKTGCSHFI